jgi:hypothetical protein
MYRQIFEDAAHHYAFDERSNFVGRKLSKKNKLSVGGSFIDGYSTLRSKIRFRFKPSLRHVEYPDMTTIVKKTAASGNIRWYHKDLVRSDLWYWKKGISDWEIVWKNGILRDMTMGEELLHFHFIRSKQSSRFRISPWKQGTAFRILPAGIFPFPDAHQESNR